MATKNDKNNFVNEKVEAVKKWWDSDTTKAVSTIIAVLLIPGAVLAWNYASGRNVNNNNNVENSILEGESTENVDTDTDMVAEETVMEESATEETTEEETPVIVENEENTDLEIGGINEVTTLPNTSSAE